MFAVSDMSDHVLRNRALWNEWAQEFAEPGRRAWKKDEPTWGIWGTPEADVGMIPDDKSEGLHCRPHRENRIPPSTRLVTSPWRDDAVAIRRAGESWSVAKHVCRVEDHDPPPAVAGIVEPSEPNRKGTIRVEVSVQARYPERFEPHERTIPRRVQNPRSARRGAVGSMRSPRWASRSRLRTSVRTPSPLLLASLGREASGRTRAERGPRGATGLDRLFQAKGATVLDRRS
jgi:hypothetical protein